MLVILSKIIWNSTISKLKFLIWLYAFFIPFFKIISSESTNIIYSPPEYIAPLYLEFNAPLLFLFLINLILLSFFLNLFIISILLSVEKSSTNIISNSFKLWFCILEINEFKYFSLLYTVAMKETLGFKISL